MHLYIMTAFKLSLSRNDSSTIPKVISYLMELLVSKDFLKE